MKKRINSNNIDINYIDGRIVPVINTRQKARLRITIEYTPAEIREVQQQRLNEFFNDFGSRIVALQNDE